MAECHFWANVMLRQSRVWASRASPQGLSCSKVVGFEGGLVHKLFKGYIFCFLVHSDGRYIFELSARETNLMKKRSVRLWEKRLALSGQVRPHILLYRRRFYIEK